MPRIRILVTTRPENCALRAVRQGPPCPGPRPPGDPWRPVEAHQRSPYPPPSRGQGSRRRALRHRRATTRMDDRSSVLTRYTSRGTCCGSGRIREVLLDLDRGAGALEGLGGLVGLLLVDLLEDRLRGAVDEVLGLLQTQGGQLAHDLDDLDLLVAGAGEDDVELVLLLLGRGSRAGLARARDGHGRGGGGDVELLLEGLHELGELDEGHLLELGKQLVLGELRHDGGPSTKSAGAGCTG